MPHHAGFNHIETGLIVSRDYGLPQVFWRVSLKTKALNLAPIALRIEAEYYFDKGTICTDPVKSCEELRIAGRDRFQQASPRKVNMDFLRYSVEFRRKILQGSLDE